MSRGKKIVEEEFYLAQQLNGFGADVDKIALILHRPVNTIKEMLKYDSFEDYESRNDFKKAEKKLDLLQPVQSYVDAEFKVQVMQMLREAFAFRPITETEVMQFIEDHENNEALMERINWHSFTKTSKYKEKQGEKF